MNKKTLGIVFPVLLIVLFTLAFNTQSMESVDDFIEDEFDMVCNREPIKAPDFTARDPQGSAHRLSDQKQKIVVLNFWASWCLPCIRELPRIQRLYEMTSDDQVEIITVNVRDRLSRVERLLEKKKYDFTIVLDQDGAIYRSFKVTQFPTTILINKEGGIICRVHGERDRDNKLFVDFITKLSRQGDQ